MRISPEDARERIIRATIDIVTESGYHGTHIALVAHRAGVGVGTVYKHFASKPELFATIYDRTVIHELTVVRELLRDTDAPPVDRLALVVRTFCIRSLRAGRLAYALMVEPVDPEVDEHRLRLREAFRELLAEILDEAVRAGKFPDQDIMTSSAAVLGIMTETLVRPLSSQPVSDESALVDRITALSVAAVSGADGRPPVPGPTIAGRAPLAAGPYGSADRRCH